MKKFLFPIALVFLLTSCASYIKRKQCESTNWFEHGKKVALSGKWLNSDSHLMECRKVEAAISESQVDQGFKNGLQIYCSPDEAYNVGKLGDIYSNDLCQGPLSTVLHQKHKLGIRDYCAKSNGFNAGSSGKKYQNVCPSELEPAFLVEYKKGRKKYIAAAIEIQTQTINRLNSEKSSASMRTHMAQMNLSRAESRLNNLKSQSTQNTSQGHKNFLDSQIRDADSDVSTAKSQYNSAESDEQKLRSQIQEAQSKTESLRLEMASLD